jgi:hypothetical protein
VSADQKERGPEYRIQREAEAARAIRESLLKLGETDPDLLLDMAEGETSLFECIDALLLRIASDKALVVGTEAVVSDLEARKRRVEKRIESDRGLIEQAMAIAEVATIERPAATLSLANRAPSLRIDSEADIPAEFWTAGAPKLERKALTDALKEGRPIPGVALSNAAPSLTMRMK